MSESCKREFDYAYDTCIYGAQQKLMKETFNCTFKLFSNRGNTSVNEKLKECKIINITNNGSNKFHDILKHIDQGKQQNCINPKFKSVIRLVLIVLIAF